MSNAGIQKVALPALVTAVVFFLSVLLRKFWTIDDALIYQNYVRNVAEGVGLIYAPDTTAEGYSSPLWMMLLSGLGMVGFRGIAAAKALGILCGLGSCLAVVVALADRLSPRAVAAIGVVVAAQPALGWWSVSGMDTPLVALLITAGFACCLKGWRRAAATCGGLLALSRPEGALLALPLVGWLMWSTRRESDSWGYRAQLVMLLAGPPAGWLMFRLAHYGALISNSSLAKLGLPAYIGQVEGLSTLVTYLGDSFVRLPTLWGFLAVGLAMLTTVQDDLEKPVRANLVAGVAFVFVSLIFVLVVAGDWMPWTRFLTPVVPVMGIWFGLVWARTDNSPAMAGVVAMCAIATLGLQARDFVPAYAIHVPSNYEVRARAPDSITDLSVRADPVAHYYSALTLRFSDPGDVVFHADVGQPGYLTSDVQIMDAFGLVSRFEAEYLQQRHSDESMRKHFRKNKPTVAFMLAFRGSGEPAMTIGKAVAPELSQGYTVVSHANWFGSLQMLVYVRNDALDRRLDSDRLKALAASARGLEFDLSVLESVAASIDPNDPKPLSIQGLSAALGWSGGR